MTDRLDTAKLTDRVAALVEAARRAGADAADAVVVLGRSTGVSVRMGKVENTAASESEDVSLRVFVGKRVASVSATAASDPKALAERAVAMAKVSPEDPYQGLADPALLARDRRDLDLFDGLRIGAVVRGGQVMSPNGDFVVRAHDRIVLFAMAERIKRVEQLFRVALEFF